MRSRSALECRRARSGARCRGRLVRGARGGAHRLLLGAPERLRRRGDPDGGRGDRAVERRRVRPCGAGRGPPSALVVVGVARSSRRDGPGRTTTSSGRSCATSCSSAASPFLGIRLGGDDGPGGRCPAPPRVRLLCAVLVVAAVGRPSPGVGRRSGRERSGGSAGCSSRSCGTGRSAISSPRTTGCRRGRGCSSVTARRGRASPWPLCCGQLLDMECCAGCWTWWRRCSMARSTRSGRAIGWLGGGAHQCAAVAARLVPSCRRPTSN